MKHRIAVLNVIATTAATAAMAAFAQGKPADTGQAARLFEPVARVLMHPRCLNCHQVEAPRQTDKGLRHAQAVVRGPVGRGATGQACSTCHQASNASNGLVPGAQHWHLAPASMSWHGLTAGDICRQMKDPARNGNRRSAGQVVEHMATDPLVLWAWAPGAGRTQPPLSHAEFLSALKRWADQGLPCPA